MGIDYNFGKRVEQGADTEAPVIVTKDKAIKRKPLRSKEDAEKLQKEYNKEKKTLVGGSRLDKLGFESSLGKEERMWRLSRGIKSGEFITVKSAEKHFSLSRGTIIKYVKELGLELFDEEKKEWVK